MVGSSASAATKPVSQGERDRSQADQPMAIFRIQNPVIAIQKPK